jgi:ferritin
MLLQTQRHVLRPLAHHFRAIYSLYHPSSPPPPASHLPSSSLSNDIQELLNDQLAVEGQASHQYLEFASWTESHGYPGASKYFYSQSNDERNHLIKLVQFINHRGGTASIPLLKVKKMTNESLNEILEYYINIEKNSMSQINEIIAQCNLKSDHMTAEFMGWYSNYLFVCHCLSVSLSWRASIYQSLSASVSHLTSHPQVC